MENLVIIGAGQSAIQCITSLKKEGYLGSITLVGEEEHLPYQRPPLSKGFLEDSVNKERLYFKKLEFFTENKIQLQLGNTAERIDTKNRQVFLKDGTDLSYDKLVFATGSRVRRLDFPGNNLESIHYLRGLDDAESIKEDLKISKDLVVIGAGYIGLEVAAIAAKNNISVTVVEMANRVMNMFMTLLAISTTVTEILFFAAMAATSNPIYPAPITTRSLLIFRSSFIDSASSKPLR